MKIDPKIRAQVLKEYHHERAVNAATKGWATKTDEEKMARIRKMVEARLKKAEIKKLLERSAINGDVIKN